MLKLYVTINKEWDNGYNLQEFAEGEYENIVHIDRDIVNDELNIRN